MNRKGFSGIETILVGATIMVIIFVAYAVYQANRMAVEDPNLQSQAVRESEQLAGQVPAAPEVKKTSDLDKAMKVLDEIDLEAGLDSGSELEAQAENF